MHISAIYAHSHAYAIFTPARKSQLISVRRWLAKRLLHKSQHWLI